MNVSFDAQNEKAQGRETTRYNADWSHPLPAQLTIGIGADEQTIGCHLADLSLQGCAIRVNQPPRSAPKFGVVRVKPQGSESELIVAGRLCWQRQTGVGTMTYGFQFRRELQQECLGKFVQEELVSQRDEKRDRVNLNVQVRQQNPQIALKVATLIDVSNSGLQLSTDVALTVGARILVILPDGKTGIGEVVWSTESEDGCLAGAGFTAVEEGRRFRKEVTAFASEGKFAESRSGR
tara:strand:- start:354635 stop:355342 length:708 start_codon:yes stop_codon:yes gene_type:complete